MTKAIRILLVDDHAMLRAGLRALLEAEPDFLVVGEAGTGEEGVMKARQLAPDVVVMDLSMPGDRRPAGAARDLGAGAGDRARWCSPCTARRSTCSRCWRRAGAAT